MKIKLLSQKMTSHNDCLWVLGEWKRATGKIKQPLCTDGWLHGYDSLLVALFHNPIHANIDNPRAFEIEVGGKRLDDNGMKFGCRKMRIVRELEVPEITITHRIAYGILAAKEVYKDPSWTQWADDWLSGKDRSAYATNATNAAAAAYATNATNAAAVAAAAAAAYATNAATNATNAATNAAAYAATYAAAAANAAANAAKIDFTQLAEEAMKVQP